MDQKVFDELMNKGIITNVGLDAASYTDIADLQNKGLATAIGAAEEYNKATADNAPETDEPTETPDEIPGGTVETPTEEEGEL